MTPSIFSSNTHLRNSHYFPSRPENYLPPPPTYSRSSAATVKNSLRKIPSALFHKEDKTSTKRSTKIPTLYDDYRPVRTAVVDHPRPLSSSPRRTASISTSATLVSQPCPTDKDKVKHKTKTRKALADILGWGNSHLSPARKSQSKAAATAASPVPLKETTGMPGFLKKKTSRPLTNKSSQSGFSAYASLRVPQETPQSRARPSLGADPFSRGESGAEIVETVVRHGGASSVKSIPLSERRGSVSSSKALSAKTMVGDEMSLKGHESRPSKITPAPTVSSLPVERTATIPAQLHISVPAPAKAVLVDLPPRSASLGRVLLDGPAGRPLSPPPSATFSVETTADKLTTGKTLKKERTKSKIWGFFVGKTKKDNQNPPIIQNPKSEQAGSNQHLSARGPAVAPSMVSVRAATLRSQTTSSQVNLVGPTVITPPLVEGSMLQDLESVATHRERPRLPILHIQQPSTDMKACLPLNTGSTLSSPPSTSFRSNGVSANHPFSANSIKPVLLDVTNEERETIRGHQEERSSDDGPRQAVVALMTNKGVPKRKSLNGVFGVALKKSLDRIRPQRRPSDEDLLCNRLTPGSFAGDKTLRSLAEELETAEICTKVVGSPASASPYVSLYDDAAFKQEQDFLQGDAALRRVASATDKLSNLVCLDFSPANTASDQASLAAPPSLTSLDGSPTPMRRVRSAVLTSKKSQSSPLKGGQNISPLKFALHRAQLASQPENQRIHVFDGSPTKTSLVRQGMRNVFAPPTPPAKPASQSLPVNSATFSDGVAQRRRVKGIPGHKSVTQGSLFSEVSQDMSAIWRAEMDRHTSVAEPGLHSSMLGSPPALPMLLDSPRRAEPSAVSNWAPRVADKRPYLAPGDHGLLATRLAVGVLDGGNAQLSVLSDRLSPAISDDFRMSFDFTSEYASLDQGHQRASFVEALAQIHTIKQDGSVLPPLPPVPSPPMSGTGHGHSVSEVSGAIGEALTDFTDDEEDSESCVEDALAEAEAYVSVARINGTPRRAPFQGQLAFQKHVAETKASPPRSCQPFNFVVPPPPPPPPGGRAPAHRRAHHSRDESGFSIASMSSLGSIIETGMAADYTNYFDKHFADHLNQQNHSRAPSADSVIRHVRSRSHHRRNSSILSIDSIGQLDVEFNTQSAGPPVSMHNPKRSSYVSRHRRGGSGEGSSFGRSDWAAHKRNSSAESTTSVISFARIGRPGLGDRMFQLDGGVQLTSITGSPPDDDSKQHRRNWSCDSLLDDSQPGYDSLLDSSANRTTVDSLLDASQEPDISREGDSVFRSQKIGGPKTFLLKGLRPDSMISTTSTEVTTFNDTFEMSGKAQLDMSPIPKGPTACLQGDGEDHTMTSRQLFASAHSGRQGPNSSLSRPAKPRRRPVNLVLDSAYAAQPDTPALSSPSASETSSRLSLETKFSEAIFSRTRPMGAGHHRQKSSAGVISHPTIKEEPSLVTLRGQSRRLEPEIASWQDDEQPVETIRSWLEWTREADEEYRRTKNCWVDSEESKYAVQAFKLPTTTAEIAEFLAKSSAAYKPLEQLPIGRIAHRRKSSLSNARHTLSPYGIPLPKPAAPPGRKKGSLQTKFERTNSATSSNFTWSEDVSPNTPSSGSQPQPPSALFAQFARELPASPPPKLAQMSPFSPFNLPFDAFGVREKLKSQVPGHTARKGSNEKRERVNSSVRREALGWGRRRNSDGPTKVQILAREAQENLVTNVDLPFELKEAVNVKAAPKDVESGKRVALGERRVNNGPMATRGVVGSATGATKGQENVNQTRKTARPAKPTPGRKAKRVTTQPTARSLRA